MQCRNGKIVAQRRQRTTGLPLDLRDNGLAVALRERGLDIAKLQFVLRKVDEKR